MYTMKNNGFFIFCAVMQTMILTACVNSIREEYPDTTTINFFVTPFTQHPMTRSASPLSDACKRMDCYVYHEGVFEQAIKSIQTDENFGTVSYKTTHGSNQFLFIGYNSESPMTFDTETKTASFDKISDTFSYCLNLDVDDNTNSAQAVQLVRRVAKFELVATDPIPSNAATMEFTIDGGCSSLNAVTGKGVNIYTQHKVINIPSSNIGKKNCTFSAYVFSASGSATINVNAVMKDSSGNVLVSHTFTDVDLSVNQITRYTGELFANDITTTVTVSTDWDSINTTDF